MDDQPVAQRPVNSEGETADAPSVSGGEVSTQEHRMPEAQVSGAREQMETPKWPFVLFALLLVAALGGGYILYQRAQTPIATPVPSFKPVVAPRPTPIPEQDDQTRVFMNQRDSEEISDIEADLNGTDLSKIDLELTQVDSEASGL